MKIFQSLKYKVIITTIIIVLINFLFAQPVSAKSIIKQAGGKLWEPVCELLVFTRRLCGRLITN